MVWSAACNPITVGYKGCTEGALMQLDTLGIDLGKTVFHLVGLNPRGEVVVRKRSSRTQLSQFTANLQPIWSAWKPALEPIFSAMPSGNRATKCASFRHSMLSFT
jgi:hypothetical protein